MAENYNLGAKFGLNIASKGAGHLNTASQAQAKSETSNIFSPVDDFFNKYEDVLNGNVAHEIGVYSRQAMIVGMNLRASDTNVRRFDVNI